MTGPEHYREAERLVGEVIDKELPDHVVRGYMATAQVHATLALAAATALRGINAPLPEKDWDSWYAAASEGKR